MHLNGYLRTATGEKKQHFYLTFILTTSCDVSSHKELFSSLVPHRFGYRYNHNHAYAFTHLTYKHSEPRSDPDTEAALVFHHSAHSVCHFRAPLERTQHPHFSPDHCTIRLARLMDSLKGAADRESETVYIIWLSKVFKRYFVVVSEA